MPQDRYISSAILDGGTAAQAFALGGDTPVVAIPNGALKVLSDADLAPDVSYFWMDVPAGSQIRFGRLDRLQGLTIEQARARMFPLPGGFRYDFVLTDEHQPNVVFLADGDAPVSVHLAWAAVLGGSQP